MNWRYNLFVQNEGLLHIIFLKKLLSQFERGRARRQIAFGHAYVTLIPWLLFHLLIGFLDCLGKCRPGLIFWRTLEILLSILLINSIPQFFTLPGSVRAEERRQPRLEAYAPRLRDRANALPQPERIRVT